MEMRDKIAEIIIHAWDTGYLKDAIDQILALFPSLDEWKVVNEIN